ncbi:mucin-5AC isoform X2 [Nerophis ophidion]|uniref:mucin-5AC isoform X2 n=1 Tax=Nerophis ophidion TaxID=159077 RepID=UPI002ADF8E39|nr:mucin-5AC isoform X2 [Nerophis ophidion]
MLLESRQWRRRSMYLSPSEHHAAPRTGIFYQAMPAIGADGKNVMSLIPVQMVNGNIVQTLKNKPQACKFIPVTVGPAPVPVGRKALMTSLAGQPTVSSPASFVNSLSNQLGIADQRLALGVSLNHHPLRIFEPHPRGHVQAVPASQPPSCRKQIFTPLTNTLSTSDPTSTTNGSSKTSVYERNAVSNHSEAESIFSASPQTSLSLGVSNAHLTLIPKVSHRSNSPMKWVIEEVNFNESSTELSHSLTVSSNTFPTMEQGSKNVGIVPSVSSKMFPTMEQGSKNVGIVESLSSKTFPTMEQGSKNVGIVPSLSSKTFPTMEQGSKNVGIVESLSSKTFPTMEQGSKNVGIVASLSSKTFPTMEQGSKNVGIVESFSSKAFQIMQQGSKNVGVVQSLSSKTFQTMKLGPNNDGVVEIMKPFPPSGLTSEADRQKALVIYDGTVFFASTKCNGSLPTGSQETLSTAAAEKVCRLKEFPVASSKSSLIISKEPNEVIDLCNDNDPEDLCQTTPLAVPLDEDNVIFVSYIPPNPKSVPTLCPVAETLENETDQTSIKSLDSVTEHNKTNLNGSSSVLNQLTRKHTNGIPTERRLQPDQSMLVSTETHNIDVISSQHRTKQQMDTMELALEMNSLSDSSISDHNNRGSTDEIKIWTNAEPVCRSSRNHKTDHLYRKMFGITSEVKICLQKMNTVSSEESEEKRSSLERKELCWQDSVIKKRKLSDKDHLPGVTVTLSPDAHALCDLDPDSVVGYVEPIDDDLPDVAESHATNSQDLAVQALNGVPTNTSRMGRARKRTKCPCCVSGGLRVDVPARPRVLKVRKECKSGGRRQKFQSNK